MLRLVQGMQHGVAGAVGERHRYASPVLHRNFESSAERALVDFAIGQASNGMPKCSSSITASWPAAHEFDGILITQVIRAFHRVVHVPVPVSSLTLRQGRGNAPLGGNGMGAGREHFGHHRHLEIGVGQLQGGTQASPAAANDQGIKSALGDWHYWSPQRICTDHAVQPDQGEYDQHLGRQPEHGVVHIIHSECP